MKWILVLLIAANAWASDAQSILKNLVAKYSGATSVVVKFAEGDGKGSLKGTATVSGPKQFRVEIGDRIIVCNGATVWNYSPSDNRVTIDKYRPGKRTLSPEFFTTQLPANARATMLPGDSNRVRLQLEPPAPDEWGAITKMIVETNEAGTEMYAVMVDLAGTSKTIRVLSTTFDKHLAPNAFEFTPPAGANVMDLRN